MQAFLGSTEGLNCVMTVESPVVRGKPPERHRKNGKVGMVDSKWSGDFQVYLTTSLRLAISTAALLVKNIFCVLCVTF
jgi:hypothetical protein